jgi:CRISPR system Cascade subunit CasE
MAKHGVTRWQDVPESHRPPLYELIHDSIREWLGDSSRPGIAARNGFHVLKDLSVDAYRQHRMSREGGSMQISTVDLSGVLEVDDPTLFTAALLGGIGHAKAFGCGLLLVRRAN